MTKKQQLVAQAKELNIKGVSKMNIAQLEAAIQRASEASEQPRINIRVTPPVICEKHNIEHLRTRRCPECVAEELADAVCCIKHHITHDKNTFCPECGYERMQQQLNAAMDDESPFIEEEEYVVVNKRIEFVSGSNLSVRFKFEGELIIVGWSKKDFKMHMYRESTGQSTFTSYASQIRMLSVYKNNVDGDVARVVKAMKRIAKKPAEITLVERRDLVAQGKKPAPAGRERQASGNTTLGKINPDELTEFREWYFAEYGEQPSGMIIRDHFFSMRQQA